MFAAPNFIENLNIYSVYVPEKQSIIGNMLIDPVVFTSGYKQLEFISY